MEKILAVVVTYNRIELLPRCIDALRKQTRKIDKILVINNGSTDRTEEWLKQQPDISFITQANSGGAGGFYTGIRTGFEQLYSWLWLMDDDGYPREDSLAKLLEGDSEELCLRNCAVINGEDKKSFAFRTGRFKTIEEVKSVYIKNIVHPFNGTLLHRKVIERVGYPDERLFLWGDETEYMYRIIRKNRIKSYTKTDSIHYHPSTTYSFKNDWDYVNDWKMYYYIRNRLSILKSQFSKSKFVATIMYFIFLIVFTGRIIVYQKTNKFRKISFVVWPFIDALNNNYSVTPTIIKERLSVTRPIYPLLYIRHHLKTLKHILQGTSSPVVRSADELKPQQSK